VCLLLPCAVRGRHVSFVCLQRRSAVAILTIAVAMETRVRSERERRVLERDVRCKNYRQDQDARRASLCSLLLLFPPCVESIARNLAGTRFLRRHSYLAHVFRVRCFYFGVYTLTLSGFSRPGT